MLSSCNCNCHECNSPCNNKPFITHPNSNSQNNIDCQILDLQTEIEEKMQNIPKYSELESKFRQLENDVQNLSEEKLQIEYELRQADKENDKLISELQMSNENILKEIKERNEMIEELYLNNNNLYSNLNNMTKDSQYLKEKLITQNDVLQKINKDRKNLRNNLNNLNELKNQDFSDIQNLEEQFDCLVNENENNYSKINELNEMNENCINEIKNETCIKQKLKNILKEKDCEIKESTHELELANETLKRLGNELNNLSDVNNENVENINLCDGKIIKESQIKEEILNKNQQLSDIIKSKEKDIELIDNQNIPLNNDINIINKNISLLCTQIEKYKQHIMNLTDMNELLSNELEGIINTDEQMRNNANNRIEYLNGLKEDNKNIINLSLKNLTTFMQENGNKGRYIKVEKSNEENNNCKNNDKTEKNKYFSFKGNNEYEEEENYEDQYSDEKE